MKTLKSKLLVVFLLIFTVIVANSMAAIINFSTLKNSINNILKANYYSVIYSQNMAIAIERQDSAELALMFKDSKESALKVFKDNEKEFLSWLEKAKGNITEKGEGEIIEKIKSYYKDYQAKSDILIAKQGLNSEKDFWNYYYLEVFPVFEKIKTLCRDLLNINQQKIVILKNNSEVIAQRAMYVNAIVSFITLTAGIVFIVYLVGKIIKPIRDLIDKIKKISERNYSQQLIVTGRDEIASLAIEFNLMASKLGYYEELNINQLMKEKQKIEAIVESINDGIIVIGAEDRILLVNKAAEKIFEISEDNALKKHFLEIIDDKELFDFITRSKSIKNNEFPKEYLDMKIKKKNSFLHFRVFSKPIMNVEGERIGMVTLFQDITKLKEIDELKSEFVSSILHELRTPITSVSLASELLQREIPDELTKSQKSLVNIIVEDTRRLGVLINDILDLSKLESGKTKFDFKKASFLSIINSVLKIMSIQIKESKTKVTLDLEDTLKPVLADKSKISQVLTNLINNSMNYKKKNKRLIIIIRARNIENDKVLVSVSDNGIGIPEYELKTIFDKFTRLEGSRSDREGSSGTGLGLSISKSIIKNHGGDIWAESELGAGSTFYFTLKAAYEMS
ncbi:MAG: ATP-binding protein [Actinomycetota bacterium]|nr:ATP-binding protein [Actinomycetota bacterium]